MLLVKDFYATLTSYNLVLEDSETKSLSEKVYNFDSDEFGGELSKATRAMLDDISNDKYKITLNIKANNFTFALLNALNKYMYDKRVHLNFNLFKNAGPTLFTEKFYAALEYDDGFTSYIVNYKKKDNIIKLITIGDSIDEDIVEQHINEINATGEYNGKKLQKFNWVETLALTFITKTKATAIFMF